MIRRPLLIAALAFGTIAGYAHGFASLRHCHNARRAAFERHVASVCAEAAKHPEKAPLDDAEW